MGFDLLFFLEVSLAGIGSGALLALVGIAVWLFRPARKERLEEPARRMLEDDDR